MNDKNPAKSVTKKWCGYVPYGTPPSGRSAAAGLLHNLRKFLMELGDGFAFVGEKVRVQVGNQDFELDLLFYHRDLQCLVAFELKSGRFEPEHLGYGKPDVMKSAA
jgi:hypothetical protein